MEELGSSIVTPTALRWKGLIGPLLVMVLGAAAMVYYDLVLILRIWQIKLYWLLIPPMARAFSFITLSAKRA